MFPVFEARVAAVNISLTTSCGMDFDKYFRTERCVAISFIIYDSFFTPTNVVILRFMILDFWKYEGAGNDFVLLRDVEVSSERVRELCDRHRGIGADGLMVLSPADGYNFRMRYYNSDGSVADMCGNGARCIALFAHHLGLDSGDGEMRFLGRDGEHRAKIVSENVVEVGMRAVDKVERCGEGWRLDTGVPHYVEFVDNLVAVNVAARGRELRFALEANVNFVSPDGDKLRVRTYERGIEGETLACGTGATAAAIAAWREFGKRFPTVEVMGGSLRVDFDDALQNITLTGPAKKVFEGRVYT